MKAVLEAVKLNKEYNNNIILKDISLSINEGEFIAIMGQSGSGKSTLLYNISGMDRADGGEIYFAGEELLKLNDEEMSSIRLKRMGFIFQQPHLLKNLSIYDNIVLPGFKAGARSREAVISYAKELMERTKITNISDHDIKKVSGGQLQRAAICRALINKPEILFGDEPTGALNTASTKEIMDIINEINSDGTAVMLVTHDSKVAARAERVIYLSDGVIKNEIKLGKYYEEHKADREYKMNIWLEKQGF